jgi:histone-lysine N-methyltransferase SUV420H
LSPETPSRKKVRAEPTVKVEEINRTFSIPTSSERSPASSVNGSRADSLSPSSGVEGPAETDATSVDEETIIMAPKLTRPGASKLRRTRGLKPQNPLEQEKSGDHILIGSFTSTQHLVAQEDQFSILSNLESDAELDESIMTIASKKTQRSRRNIKGTMSQPKTDLDHAPAVRVPGDYVLTPALLAEPASAWINCKICESPFVQKDAYFTRSSCPRCERHSKLYGYMWPKTDKVGRNDSEERVLDHRTVHRFIRPSEERLIRKRDRDTSNSRSETREISEAVVEEMREDMGRRSGRKRTKRDRFTL